MKEYLLAEYNTCHVVGCLINTFSEENTFTSTAKDQTQGKLGKYPTLLSYISNLNTIASLGISFSFSICIRWLQGSIRNSAVSSPDNIQYKGKDWFWCYW